MTTSPSCTVNGNPTINGIDVTGGSTVTIALADLSGVSKWSISCVGTDGGRTAADISSGLTINQVNKTATFTAPSDGGSALLFRSVVNNGQNINGKLIAAYSTTFIVHVPLANSLHLLALNETTESNAAVGWIGHLNDVARSAGTVAGPSIVRLTHASSSTSLVSGQLALVDVSGGTPPTITTPATPTDGASILVKNSGGDFANTSCTITAHSGQTIEDPNFPETFGASATLGVTSCFVQWVYDLTSTKWRVAASYYPIAPSGLIQSPPNADLVLQAGLYTGSSSDHRNLIVNFGRGNPSHSNQGSALVRQDPEGILLDEHATSPGSGDFHNNTWSHILSGTDFGRTYDIAGVFSSVGGTSFIQRSGSNSFFGIEGTSTGLFLFRMYDDTNGRPAMQVKIQGAADSFSYHSAPDANQDNAIQLGITAAPTGSPGSNKLWVWHDGTSYTWVNSAGTTILRGRPVASGAGNPITIGGGLGHTPGTDRAGNTNIDLGILNASNQSAQLSVLASGASIFAVAQTSSATTNVSCGSNNLNVSTPGAVQTYTSGVIGMSCSSYVNTSSPFVYCDVSTSFNVRNIAGTVQFSVDSTNGIADFHTAPITTTAPSAGAGGALPATPAGYMTIKVDGVSRQVAYY